MIRSLVASLLAAAAAFAASGCTSSGLTDTSISSATLLQIDPSLFQGGVRCAPGALRKYVVTLQDVSRTDPPVPPNTWLAPVGPVSCTDRAFYAAPPLVVGHWYLAAIQGYDEDDLTPAIGEDPAVTGTPGSPNMWRVGTMTVVPPRWSTTCGELTDGGSADVDATTTPDWIAFRPPTLIFGSVTNELEGCLPFGSPIAGEAGIEDAGTPTDAGPDATDAGEVSPEGGAVEGGAVLDGQDAAAADAPGTDASLVDGAAPDVGASLDGTIPDATAE
jgi:hypothetical protein